MFNVNDSNYVQSSSVYLKYPDGLVKHTHLYVNHSIFPPIVRAFSRINSKCAGF